MKIEIDQQSGFCFGVEKVIKTAEDILKEEGKVYCLGEIVHNQREMERLMSLGLITIDYETYRNMKNEKNRGTGGYFRKRKTCRSYWIERSD